MNYILAIAIFILIYIILTQSYNLILGYTGMIHIGHMAFMAIGAYTSSLLAISGIPSVLSVLIGMGGAGIAGLILGIPSIRFKEDYLVVATLGLAEIVRAVLINWTSVTEGPLGLPGIPQPNIFGFKIDTNFEYLVFIGLIALLVNIFIYRLVKSPFGRILEVIREDETAALSIGKNVFKYKLTALTLGAMIAGLAGALLAHYTTFIEPNIFCMDFMGFVLLIVIFGGGGNFWGPIIGTAILYSLSEIPRFLPFPPAVLGPMRWLFYAIILVIIVIFKPTGLMGKKLLKKKY